MTKSPIFVIFILYLSSIIKIPIILNLTALFMNINLTEISHFTISKKKKKGRNLRIFILNTLSS